MEKRCIAVLLAIALLLLGISGVSSAGQKSKSEIQPIPEEILNLPEDQLVQTLSSPSNESLDYGSLSASGTGTVIVRNLSRWYVDLYGDGKLLWKNLPPGYYWKSSKIARGWHTGYAVCCCAHWGPIKIYLNKKFVWTLYD